ncbi:MAG TPA: protein translocase subunit SecF, partial [Dehalococcoidia bacterium]|nr:protein translocase subunit SecF [Dehalococcoidia bacterium]
LGAYSIMGKLLGAEVNTMFIVGMLTIIGYSVHDTIVVFDRIRENRLRYSAHELEHVVNISLWETMTRSINTSMSVVIAIVALLLLGGPTIRDFLLVLLIGVVSGTYSSIFTASQFVVSWEKGDLRRLGRLLPRPLPAR